jgi:hypothetical protein
MIAAAAFMPDSGSCHVISYAMDTLPASRCCHSGGARAAATLTAMVVLPTPPLPLPTVGRSGSYRREGKMNDQETGDEKGVHHVHLALSWVQLVFAFMISLAALVGGLGSGVNDGFDFGCKQGWWMKGCPLELLPRPRQPSPPAG